MNARDRKILNDLLTATREGQLTWGLEGSRTGRGFKSHGYVANYENGSRSEGFARVLSPVIVECADPAWQLGFGPRVCVGAHGYITASRFSKAGQIVAEIYDLAAKQVAERQAAAPTSRNIEL